MYSITYCLYKIRVILYKQQVFINVNMTDWPAMPNTCNTAEWNEKERRKKQSFNIMKAFKMYSIVLKYTDNNEKKIGTMQSNLWDISCSTRKESFKIQKSTTMRASLYGSLKA